jgi:hypothetical protein
MSRQTDWRKRLSVLFFTFGVMGWSVAFQNQLWNDEDERRRLSMTTHICGIDIGKTVFHLVGLSKEGHIIVKKRFNRKQLLTYTVNLPACLIGIEACAGPTFSLVLL